MRFSIRGGAISVKADNYFWAGENGKILYKYFGKEKVYCFCDNKISGGAYVLLKT